MKDAQTDNTTKTETKEEKFLRLSENRVNNIVKGIRNLANLSNKNNYNYTDEQVDKLFAYIEKNLQDAKNRFKGKENVVDKFSW